MSAEHPRAFAPLVAKNHRRGCITPVTHTWQHNNREEPLLSYTPACAQRTLHWIHGFLGSGVPQRCTTVLHAKRVKYQEIRTPSQLLSAHSSLKGSVVVGARAWTTDS